MTQDTSTVGWLQPEKGNNRSRDSANTNGEFDPLQEMMGFNIFFSHLKGLGTWTCVVLSFRCSTSYLEEEAH